MSFVVSQLLGWFSMFKKKKAGFFFFGVRPYAPLWGKANMHNFRYISRPKMHILSTRLLGVPFGPQGAMPDPAPHRGVPGTKVFNKITKKCTGDKPRPLPGAEPARWAATQEIFQAPWGLPWTWDWVQVRPWGVGREGLPPPADLGVQVYGRCRRPKRHFIFWPQAWSSPPPVTKACTGPLC